MYYLIIFTILLIAGFAVFSFLKSKYAAKASPQVRNGLSFLLLSIPLILILIRLDRLYQPFGSLSLLAKGFIIALIIICINTVLYSFIRFLAIRIK